MRYRQQSKLKLTLPALSQLCSTAVSEGVPLHSALGEVSEPMWLLCLSEVEEPAEQRTCQSAPLGKLSCSTSAAGGSAMAECTCSRLAFRPSRCRCSGSASQRSAGSVASLPDLKKPSNTRSCEALQTDGQQTCRPLMVAPVLHVWAHNPVRMAAPPTPLLMQHEHAVLTLD